MKTLIIIPAYNEEENIKEVIDGVKKEEPDAKILVIDDGSSDSTASVVKNTKKADIIMLPHNLGIGGAVQTGFKYARKNTYDMVVRVDADGQHRAEEIRDVMQPVVEKKADMVIGSRFLAETGGYPILTRRIGQKIIAFFTSLIARQKITDSTSGFRCYNKRATTLLSKYYPTDSPGGEEIIFLQKNAIKIKEVPISIKMREKGKSSITTLDSIFYMIKVVLSIFINVLRTPIIK